MLLLFGFFLSSVFVYLFMEIFVGLAIQFSRYFYVPLTIALVFLMVLIFSVLGRRAAETVSYIILAVCVGITGIWYSCYLKEASDVTKEVESCLAQAEERGIKTVVFYNCESQFGSMMVDVHSYYAQSTYYCPWSTYFYLSGHSNLKT